MCTKATRIKMIREKTYLHVIVPIEGFAANSASELHWTDMNLSGTWYPKPLPTDFHIQIIHLLINDHLPSLLHHHHSIIYHLSLDGALLVMIGCCIRIILHRATTVIVRQSDLESHHIIIILLFFDIVQSLTFIFHELV